MTGSPMRGGTLKELVCPTGLREMTHELPASSNSSGTQRLIRTACKAFMLEALKAHNKQDVPLNFVHFFFCKGIALIECHWLLSMEIGLIYYSMTLPGSIS